MPIGKVSSIELTVDIPCFVFSLFGGCPNCRVSGSSSDNSPDRQSEWREVKVISHDCLENEHGSGIGSENGRSIR